MDEAKMPDNQIVERYVHGKLSEEESTQFEEYYLARPELIEQIETEQLLQAGFKRSNSQDEIAVQKSVLEDSETSLFEKFLDLFTTPLPAYAFLLPLALVIPIAVYQPPTTEPIIELIHFTSKVQRSGLPPLEINIEHPSQQYGLLVKVTNADLKIFELRLVGNSDKPYSWVSSSFSVGALQEQLVVVPANVIEKGRYRIEIWGSNESKIEKVQVESFCHFVERC